MNADTDTVDKGFPEHTRKRRAHWNNVAAALDEWKGYGGYYHRKLEEIYSLLTPVKSRILEIGCGQGDLLSSLDPAYGVGIDFSDKMIQRAKTRHPRLTFIQADAHDAALDEKFDVIILSDLVNDLWDVQTTFKNMRKFMTPRTRVVMNFYSRLWEIPLMIAGKMEMAKPVLNQNWLTADDISGLLDLTGFEPVRQWSEILLPLKVPLLTAFFNRIMARLWPFKHAALTNFIIARPLNLESHKHKPKVSVLIPARNEAGNIPAIFERTPEMGGGVELVFVEGHSTDDTYKAIEDQIALHPDRDCILLRQSGEGKGNAVREGFAKATGDVLMILDADMTVPPEDLPRFLDTLVEGKGEFINGVRLVYPLEREAMRFLNIMGNKFFSLTFSWLLEQPIKDTLCGTKVLWKDSYELIAANRAYFGDFDPFGDFDLLFGAAKANMKIQGLPIRYKSRSYGSTNIKRWKHGLLLLRMALFATRRIKFR